jgi:hypothetical protein
VGVLQGTFDTLSLTEVLGLLAQSQKTGALWLEAPTVQGRVYLADGRCHAAETTELADPVATAADLESRLVEVCFTLARQHDGSFRFVADEVPTWEVADGVAVDDAVAKLDRLLEEWREIQAIIPSLDARPRLADELGSTEIIIDAQCWRLLVSLDGHRSVRDVMHHTQRSVLDVCNAIKELVELGAVEIAPEAVVHTAMLDTTYTAATATTVAEPPEPADLPETAAGMPDPFGDDEAAATDAPADSDDDAIFERAVDAAAEVDEAAAVERAAAWAQPTGDGAEAAPAELDEATDDTEARDRGALLRLFSALRDT